MDNALQAGIEYSQFWEMSYQEIEWVVNAYIKKRDMEMRQQISINYGLAANTAVFAALSINGKKIPTFEEVYPDLFEDTQSEEDKAKHEQQVLSFYQLQMVQYANQFNEKRRKEGKVNDIRGTECQDNSQYPIISTGD